MALTGRCITDVSRIADLEAKLSSETKRADLFYRAYGDAQRAWIANMSGRISGHQLTGEELQQVNAKADASFQSVVDFLSGEPIVDPRDAELARLRETVLELAVKWQQSFTHRRDICDEGISTSDETAEQALYDAVATYAAAEQRRR
jgi:hypothetical protein